MSVPKFPIVGVGASAGGLGAFEALLGGMAPGTLPGMAFVLVQHLDPDHKSLLAELMARMTRLPVIEVSDPVVVQVNCVYVIPPGRDLTLRNGTLLLSEPEQPRGQRLAIDHFLTSLALEQGAQAIGIVLSGTGADGAQGARAIRAVHGLVLAQDPATAEFEAMPRSAIATGAVDLVLEPSAMIPRLMARTTPNAAPGATGEDPARRALDRIFHVLRSQTGHDFSAYKPGTIQRRIERRMAVHHLAQLDEYVRLIQRMPDEVDALFRDLLIGVTSFFRDPEAFRTLEEQVIPALFSRHGAADGIRIWSVGCSTGQEAYSLAILLAEYMERHAVTRPVQLFATDLDGAAITRARAGLFLVDQMGGLSPERLERFFMLEPDQQRYRVRKEIRDMIIFSKQDVLKDPPFSRLDLISCRNLLIYVSPEVQAKLMATFHFALRSDGVLFLGSSEGAGDSSRYFAEIDRAAKLYRRMELAGAPAHPVTIGSALGLPVRSNDLTTSFDLSHTSPPMKLPLRELTEHAVLRELPVSGALVNGEGAVLYFHGRTGLFLEPAAGEAGVANILTMARDGLRFELAAALRRAVATQEVVRLTGVSVRTNGHFTRVDLTVRPLSAASTDAGQPLFVVVLAESHDQAEAAPAAAPGADDDASPRVAALTRELAFTKELLQNTRSDLQLTAEHLRTSNEEMKSVNEELQSTNEELETSKEELQSVNEELATVNTELQIKVTDLSRANNDMNNLLAGSNIGTVFVDHQLRILRFTPSVREIINVIPSDVGRPVGHLVANLEGYNSLVDDTQHVLDTLQPKAVDVRTHAGHPFSMRIQPYRTLDNVIEGAVISFVDTTEIVDARDALRKANDLLRLAVVVRDAQDAITVQDLDGKTTAWNAGAERLYGWTEAEALTMNVRDRTPPAIREEAAAQLEQLSRSATLEARRTTRLHKNGSTIDVSLVSTALLNDAGTMYAVATTERALSPSTR